MDSIKCIPVKVHSGKSSFRQITILANIRSGKQGAHCSRTRNKINKFLLLFFMIFFLVENSFDIYVEGYFVILLDFHLLFDKKVKLAPEFLGKKQTKRDRFRNQILYTYSDYFQLKKRKKKSI